jgi:hypothetical protein
MNSTRLQTQAHNFLRTGRHLLRKSIQISTRPFVHIDFENGETPLISTRIALSADAANTHIGNLLQGNAPFMVARFGTSELEVVKRYRKIQMFSNLEKLADYGATGEWNFSWNQHSGRALGCNAGFFPVNPSNLNRFAQLMIDAMGHVDLLASWVNGEGYFKHELQQAALCQLAAIEPYYHQQPWSQFLAGKRVLVIHPFVNSIQTQYHQHRRQLFQNPLVLPEFELITQAAVQSIAGNHPSEYPDWFAALADMYEQAIQTRTEVVILGCGAYGFPLAAMLKWAGKQVIHLGGATQILFGIRGQRWDQHPVISGFYNQYWSRPSLAERPPGVENVEAACYW